MNTTEQSFLIWTCLTLLSIIAFIGVLFINYFIKMANDINAIKTTVMVQSNKHNDLERRVANLEPNKK